MQDIPITKLKAVLCVTPPELERRAAECLSRGGAHAITEFTAQGSAPGDLIHLLGLAETARTVLLAVVRAEDADGLKSELAEKLLTKPGTGIAAVIRINGFIGLKTVFKYIETERINGMDTKQPEARRAQEIEYHSDPKHMFKLIVCIVNRGFSDEAMDAAREAGAKGGTILHGRGTGGMTHTVLGMKIEPEKELVLIVAERERTAAIMDALFKTCGLGTHGNGICFALPIEDVVGLHWSAGTENKDS